MGAVWSSSAPQAGHLPLGKGFGAGKAEGKTSFKRDGGGKMLSVLLGILALMLALGWIKAWFHKQLLVAYLTMKRIDLPTVEDLKVCAKIVKDGFFRH